MAKIYIDPGHNHSGADTGAVGFGLKEQDVTVEIGVKLCDLLCKTNQTVKMSRSKITDVVADSLSASLSGRYNEANNWNADIFVSIHCNAANTKAYGCETFCYNANTEGSTLADHVQKHLVKETNRVNRGVKTASFAVLKYTKMPAILVETAFIDNYDDNKFLASEEGKTACALAIYKGICDYLEIEYNLDGSESEDEIMSKEYDELKAKDQKHDEILNSIGQDIEKNKADINTIQSHLAKYDYVDENMPSWAVPTITKLVTKGYLKGDEEGKLGLTIDLIRLYVVNDRAGIYGE